MKIGLVCYPTYGGSGVVATELGKQFASQGHEVHFISYARPVRLSSFVENIYFHEVEMNSYPLFKYQSYGLSLTSKMLEVIEYEQLDLIHGTLCDSSCRECLSDQADFAEKIMLISKLLRPSMVPILRSSDLIRHFYPY